MSQPQLLERCCNYIQELVEIYEMSGANDYTQMESDLNLLYKMAEILGHSNTKTNSTRPQTALKRIRRVDDIIKALGDLGGKAHLSAIYKKVDRIRKLAGRSVPVNSVSAIRECLETHSSDSKRYKPSNSDLFKMAEGRGAGIWALRNLTQ